MDKRRLDRARDELRRAAEDADGTVQTQLDSLEGGLYEEESGDSTRDEPGPKIDRIVEVTQKLEGLAAEVDDRAVADRIDRAHDLLEAYLKNHPDDA